MVIQPRSLKLLPAKQQTGETLDIRVLSYSGEESPAGKKVPCGLAGTLKMMDGFSSATEVRNQEGGFSFQGWSPCKTGPQLPHGTAGEAPRCYP